MEQNDQYALEVFKQWMDATARSNYLQDSSMQRFMERVIESRPATYDAYLAAAIAEQDALQLKLDRWWLLLQAWRRGENILIQRLSSDD